MEVAARHPALAHGKSAWEFGGITASPLAANPASPPLSAAPSSPPFAVRSTPPSARLSQARPLASPPGVHVAPVVHVASPPAAADSNPGPVDPVHTSRPGVPCLCLVVPSGTVLIIMSCLVLSTETCLGQAVPRVVAMEASPSCLPLLSLKWKRLLRDPVRAPDSLSCPEEASASKLAQEGFLFLWAVLSCLVPVCLVLCGLSCPVCLAPEGS